MITLIAKKDLVDDRYLRICDTKEVRDVVRDCKDKRLSNGKALSKDKGVGAMADIPATIYWNPAFKHIFRNPDPIERMKLTRKFLEERSAFKTTTRRLI